eukprot:gnl/TRDRNA2_/TRDRNA2_162499_c0_seq2.p1 gnl/TRDRNA2_/TRDRNA2_162499_c0~~gnl/TRDRNA2_/TRDRNA2_162499_c0_seq2.p1  ORF type:complete len:228 (-),score=25.77 gnl/TRDRNA2_/TRDRNA2_162499_c0_seq2:169-852(-)
MIDPAFDTCTFIEVPDGTWGIPMGYEWPDTGPRMSWGSIACCADRLWCAPHTANTILTMLLPRPDLKMLQGAGRGFDVEIESDSDATFRTSCHKCVLILASPVLERMLQHDAFTEGHTNTIKIQGASAKSVQHLVEHLYSGALPSDCDLIELAGLARAYELKVLLAQCLESLARSISVDNYAAVIKTLNFHADANPEATFWWRTCKHQVRESASLYDAIFEAALKNM